MLGMTQDLPLRVKKLWAFERCGKKSFQEALGAIFSALRFTSGPRSGLRVSSLTPIQTLHPEEAWMRF